MKPSILNPQWKYTPSGKTDIRLLFKRVKRELREQSAKPVNVVQIKKEK